MTPPCPKLPYRSAREAHDVLRHVLRGKRGSHTLQVYRCRWCDAWHLGRSAPRRRSP